MTSALQVNPSIMTRSHHGGVTTDPHLPSRCDLSLRRHQLGVFSHSGHSSAMHPYCTTYEYNHQHKYSPAYANMSNRQADQPSGATHNNVRTTIAPRDPPPALYKSIGDARVKWNGEGDPQAAAKGGDVSGLVENHMGEESVSYPFRSTSSSTFVSPLSVSASLGAAATLRRDSSMSTTKGKATHAIAPPFCSDDAQQEAHVPHDGSGYTTNNSFAFLLHGAENQTPLSHYKQAFEHKEQITVPTLGDDSVQQTGAWRNLNGYLRNGDLLPGIHQMNEGGRPWDSRDFLSQARFTQQTAIDAPRPEEIPSRTIQRPHTVSVRQTRRRTIEPSAFTRSESGPPADGVGSEHIKLRLAQPETGVQHLSTRPHTSGFAAAPAHYHSSHPHRVAPISTRIGSGLEESQMVSKLSGLRTKDPAEYWYELAGAPRYMSTQQLMHGDKFAEKVAEDAATFGSDAGSEVAPHSRVTSKGRAAGWGERNPSAPASVENGGVRNAYESSYDRFSSGASQLSASVRAKGKSVSQPQGTGYTANTPFGDLVAHAKAAELHRFSRYTLTSHEAHKNPSVYARELPPATGSQLTVGAPLQSAYSREHMTDYIFPQPSWNTVRTIDNRTVVVQADARADLHPTVVKALEVKEACENGNWGGKTHPLKPIIPL